MGRNRIGVSGDQVSGMVHSFFARLSAKPVHKDVEKRGSCSSRCFSLGQEPGFEAGMVGDRKTFQELPAKLCGQLEEMFSRKSIRVASSEFLSNFEQVNRRAFGIEENVFAIGNNPFLTGLVDKRAQPAQGPSKRSARIIGQIPQ